MTAPEPAVVVEPDAGESYESIVRVTTMEVFFDLVFVFAITQLTTVLVDEPTVPGAVRVVLMFGVIQWIYGGYVWLANAVAPTGTVRRLLSLLGMVGFLVIAIAIPAAFGDYAGGLLFGLGYLLTVVVHTVLFTRSANASSVAGIFRIAPFNLLAAVLILVGGIVGDRYQYGLWTLALALLAATPWLSPVRMFRVQTAHFVERYGLLLIIVLGESIVAIGVGASHSHLDVELVATAVLALAVTAGLWWMYFTRDDEASEHYLASLAADRRARPALNAFFYAIAPMLMGVVVFAAGVKKAVAHPFEHIGEFGAVALAGGVALFLLGSVLFRAFLRLGTVLPRLAAAVAVLLTVPLGTDVTAAGQLGAIVVLLIATIALDHRFTRRGTPLEGAE